MRSQIICPNKFFVSNLKDTQFFNQSLHFYLMPTKKYPNRFTEETGTISNLKQQITSLQEKLGRLQAEIQKLQNINNYLKERVETLESISSKFFETLYNEDSISPILKQYVHLLKKNITRQPKGYRYKELKEYFTLLSFMGPHYYGILSDNMIFPSYKRVLDYKKEFLQEFQITNDLFDGSVENIIQIIQKFLPSNFDGKAVMMVDAASVIPYVKVYEDGTVEGIIGCQKVEKDQVNKFFEDETKLLDFIKENENNLIQAEFGITFAPLNPEYKPFPIACIQATTGKATVEFRDFIEELILDLKEFYNIIGLGTDGDNTYHIYSSSFMKSFMKEINSLVDMNIEEIIEKLSFMMHFSDPYHLVKRDRYNKLIKIVFCISPLNLNCIKSVDDLENIGIPQYILDDNKGRKMEDGLPKKMFSLLNIQIILDREDYSLLISMLPSTLLMESLHNDDLSRKSTIDFLLLGASIVIIYYSLSNYVIEGKAESLEINIDEYKRKMCFTNEWCEEYIFTAMNIAYLVYTEENIDVGSCGSHDQEHVFGNVRRHSKNDNTHSKFIKSMKYILLEKELYNKLNIEQSIPNSRSESGRSIYGGQKPIIHEFRYYLSYAKRLWNNIVSFPKELNISTIEPSEDKLTIEELKSFFGTFSEKIMHSISTKSTGMIKTGGLANVKIWNARDQHEDLIDGDDSE